MFAMIDVDNFKHFNDDFGHSAGDVVLQNIGAVMKESIRDCDHIYRYGGDEFLVVFMDAGPDEGYRLADRLRLAVKDELNELRVVTISVGLSSLPRDGTEPGKLVDLADRALYAAKREGRNRIVVWSASEERVAN